MRRASPLRLGISTLQAFWRGFERLCCLKVLLRRMTGQLLFLASLTLLIGLWSSSAAGGALGNGTVLGAVGEDAFCSCAEFGAYGNDPAAERIRFACREDCFWTLLPKGPASQDDVGTGGRE